MTLYFFVEEPSVERALTHLLPKIVDEDVEYFPFSGKPDLLRKLPDRLRGYAKWAPAAGIRIVVLVDRDDDDCHQLKARLENIASEAGLTTLTASPSGHGVMLLNRIVVEELESWLLGDVDALRRAYPKLPVGLAAQARFRDPENVPGGCWEALEGVLQEHGYHSRGLRKIQLADDVAPHMSTETNRARSFAAFCDGVRRLVGGYRA
jgi:Domain of unknown function (DUF4276)